MFSAAVLRESLAFGLPRVPHGFAQQVMAVGDKFILSRFVTVAEIGVYSMGVSFGLIPKLFLEAFEIRVGAVLLRHRARAGRDADIQRGHDLRRRGARAA